MYYPGKYRLIFYIVIVGLISFPNKCFSKDLIVAVDHFPPWTIIQGEKVSGINIEVLTTLALRLDLTLKYKICPWKRCLSHMMTGQADIMTSLLKRPEREVYMDYIAPPYKTKSAKAFYLKKGMANHIRRYEDLYRLTIGVERGTKYFPPFDDDPKINKHIITHGSKQLPKLLLGDRIDAFIDTESSMDFRLKTEPELAKGIEKSKYRYNYEIPVYMALSKKSEYAAQLPLFNSHTSKLVSRGKVDAIIKNFLRH